MITPPLPAPSPPHSERNTYRQLALNVSNLRWLVLFALLIAYSLPWLRTPTISGLTNNATDLAEWVSIHPSVRGEPFLLTALLLRLPLVCIAGWIGSRQTRHDAPLPFIVIITLLAIALLPPFEFFTSARTDPNYQQQFALAIAAFVGSIAGIFSAARLDHRTTTWLQVGALLLAAVSALWGTWRAIALFANLDLNSQWGIGAPLFCSLCLAGIGASLSAIIKQGR